MSNDELAIAAIAAVSDVSKTHPILHFLYVASGEAAAAVARELRRQGFHTEERLGWDSVNWLVVARHEAIPAEELLASTRRSMEKLAADFGGEYDGWEAEVRNYGHDGSGALN